MGGRGQSFNIEEDSKMREFFLRYCEKHKKRSSTNWLFWTYFGKIPFRDICQTERCVWHIT